MNYQEAMNYLDRAKVFGSVLGLSTMRALLDELGNPHRGLPTVHIAGTNGKGSTAAYLAEILKRAGYRTGLYISPFIQRFGERIQVDGTRISEEEIAALMSRVAGAAEAMVQKGAHPPTVFELITAMGFLHFRAAGCEIAVVEVGLGGRLDATNVIESPEVSVITHIGLDHTLQLGNTLEQIAGEKGGIIKPDCPTVLYGQEDCVNRVIADICRDRGCALSVADAADARLRAVTVDGLSFDWGGYEGLRTGLTGLHQLGNAVTALETVRVLREKGWRIGDDALRAGLANARCIGRLELMRREPVFLVDGAHNPQGVEALLESLRALFPGKKFVFLMGILADKDYLSAAGLILPWAKRIYAMTPPVPRALPSKELAALLRAKGDAPVKAFDTVEAAVEAALREAEPDEVLCAFGSLYQIGSIRAYFGLAERETWKE